jgi:molybdopterin synthase catalytic subunit
VAVLDMALSLDEVAGAVEGPGRGGLVSFVGYVRSHGQLAEVDRLVYEAYVPMAEQVLAAIADEIELEYPGVRMAIHHRTGTLAVGEKAVVIASAAPHRAEAFAACRLAIERLKQRAPIWKKEIGPAGELWVGMGP